MVELILIEIVAVPAECSRGRHNPRVVKRKMSGFKTKARAAPASGRVFRYEDHIRVVAPVGSPADQAPSPTATARKGRKRRRPGRASAPTGRPSWLEHVRAWRASGLARAAYCERHGLNPPAFHQWVARSRPTFRRSGPPPSYSLSQRYCG
ncbi:MAG TPA: hypothetical protein VFG47_05450 [Geminicoccaceae bacterium]|nr:hypothetical protein [Geminicoccaceae bacterium]